MNSQWLHDLIIEQYAKRNSQPGQISFAWDEEKHPRDPDGKFAEADGRTIDFSKAASWKIKGTTDERTECDKCGKVNLKGTVCFEVTDADGNGTGEHRYLGSECASQVTRKSATAIRNKARDMDQQAAREEKWESDSKSARIGTDKPMANLFYSKTKRPLEGSQFYYHEDGRMVRVQTTDPKDDQWYRKNGFAPKPAATSSEAGHRVSHTSTGRLEGIGLKDMAKIQSSAAEIVQRAKAKLPDSDGFHQHLDEQISSGTEAEKKANAIAAIHSEITHGKSTSTGGASAGGYLPDSERAAAEAMINSLIATAPEPAGGSRSIGHDELFKRDASNFEAIQSAMGFKKPKLGKDGAAQINQFLQKHPGGAVLAAVLSVDGSQTKYDRNGYADRGMDAYRAQLDGKFSRAELDAAAKWLQSTYDYSNEELGHVNQHRWIAGAVKTATPKGEQQPQSKANPFKQQADAMRSRAESLSPGGSSHDKAMASAFPFGTGRSGNASSRRTSAQAAKRIDSTVNNAIKATKLFETVKQLEAKAAAFDRGEIDEHGGRTEAGKAIDNKIAGERIAKQEKAKKYDDHLADHMRQTLKPGDVVYVAANPRNSLTIKRINSKSITTDSGSSWKYDELIPPHSEGRAMTTKEMADVVKQRMQHYSMHDFIMEHYAAKKKSQPGQQEFQWITVHPNNGPGHPVMIDKDGTIQAGMGGKFNGQKIGEMGAAKPAGEAKPAETAAAAPTREQAQAKLDAARAERNKMVRMLPVGQLVPTDLKRWEEVNRAEREAVEGMSPFYKQDREAKAKEEDEKRERFATAEEKRIAALPVKQKRNGWHLASDGARWFVKDPNTGESIYSGSLKRAREVADESAPDPVAAAPEAELSPKDKLKAGNEQMEALTAKLNPLWETHHKTEKEIREIAEQPPSAERDRKYRGAQARLQNLNDKIKPLSAEFENIREENLKHIAAIRAADKPAAEQPAEAKQEPATDPHEELLARAAKHSDYGPDYKRDIAMPAARLKNAKKLGHSGQMLEHLAGELKARLDHHSPENKPEAAAQSPAKETGYHNGDQVEFTGKTESLHGAEWREFKYTEGHKKGKTGLMPTEAQAAKDTAQKQADWKSQQEQFARLKQPKAEVPAGLDPVHYRKGLEAAKIGGSYEGAMSFSGTTPGTLPHKSFSAGLKAAQAASRPPKAEQPGITMPAKPTNEQARPGDQLGMFGEATRATKAPGKVGVEGKDKQRNLIDGLNSFAGQMSLIDEAGAPDDMIYKGGKGLFAASMHDLIMDHYRAGAGQKAKPKKTEKAKTTTGQFGDTGRYITLEDGRVIFIESKESVAAKRKKRDDAAKPYEPKTILDKAIVEYVGSNRKVVEAFKPFVEDAYKMMNQEASETTHALRNVLSAFGHNGKAASAFISNLRHKRDYSGIAGFDEMAEYAAKYHPELLAGRTGESSGAGDKEQAFFNRLRSGFDSGYAKHSPEVLEMASQMAGGSFFDDDNWKEDPHQIEGVPFAAALHDIIMDHYRANSRSMTLDRPAGGFITQTASANA